MSVTVSYGSLLSFLDTQLDREVDPTDSPRGLCLVAGGIVGRNLEDELARQDIPTAGVDISTIEETARTLLDAHHRRRGDDPNAVEILDQQLCEALVVDAITNAPCSGSDSLDAVADLLSAFDWAGRPTLRDTLWNELDRYFRMTDAGSDHAAAVDVAVDLVDRDPYAGSRSRKALTAFKQLHTALQQRTADLPETTSLSRSHLVAAAREVLATEWTACYPDIEWVAVDTISVLDNPTLRLFETLATLDEGPELYFFGTEAGAGSTLYDRLAATSLDPDLRESDEPDLPHVAALMDTVEGAPPESVPNTAFIEAPDGRRELDAVARRIRDLTGMAGNANRSEPNTETNGTTCGDIVIAAKDVIPYRSRIDDVFTSHGIPTHIEARQPLMQTVPYRYLQATFELLTALTDDGPVTAEDLVDPLRLGFCPPESTGEWPIDGETVAEIDGRLEALGNGSASDDGQSVDDWTTAIRAAFSPTETPAIHTYVDWLEATVETPPESGEEVAALVESLLDALLTPLAEGSVRQPAGPGIDARRTALGTKHDSHIVARLRRQADRVGRYVDRAVETDLGEPGWKLATTALKNVCGGASYWPRNADGNAVRIVNAANAHYLDADYVFVIGLAAEEFPAERSPPNFFHEGLYTAVRDTASETDDGAAAYLHAPTSHTQFEGDIDEYRAAVGAATEGVRCCRQYRTTEGDPLAWSGFVDAYTARAEGVQQIAASEWLPPVGDEDPAAASRTATPRDRLRLLAATFPEGVESGAASTGRSAAALTDREGIVDLLSRVGGDAYTTEIEPRRRRYRGQDSRPITVDPNEPAFDSQTLAELVGPPIRLHELDLHTNCQLKYYFHQYIDDGSTDRDAVGDLPTPLGERYPTPAFRDGLRRLITADDRLADRQAALGRYGTLGEFRDQLASWIETDPSVDRRLMQPLLGEYQAVQRELAAGIGREWRWEPASTIRIGGHAVRVPGHRVDVLSDTELEIPVWYTDADGAAQGLVEQSMASGGSITARDHRLLVSAETVDTFAGCLVYDPTSATPTEPRGIVVGDDLNPLPDVVPEASNLARIGRTDWQQRHEQWLDETTTALGSMTASGEPITYCVSESFVDGGGCRGCDFRDLCRVPATHKRGDQ